MDGEDKNKKTYIRIFALFFCIAFVILFVVVMIDPLFACCL